MESGPHPAMTVAYSPSTSISLVAAERDEPPAVASCDAEPIVATRRGHLHRILPAQVRPVGGRADLENPPRSAYRYDGRNLPAGNVLHKLECVDRVRSGLKELRHRPPYPRESGVRVCRALPRGSLLFLPLLGGSPREDSSRRPSDRRAVGGEPPVDSPLCCCKRRGQGGGIITVDRGSALCSAITRPAPNWTRVARRYPNRHDAR